MSKLDLDHSRATSGARTRAYLRIDRAEAAEGSHPATKAAHRGRGAAGGRLKPFTRIERGQKA
ncbi:hypothetical protein [Pseudoroseicyclus sp. CXY001]|uniref:hypothetical protein n=1 Tax=Pseudoroseicyclus sp. CXY001 TaxID=3242492 RepID=UPI003570EA03